MPLKQNKLKKTSTKSRSYIADTLPAAIIGNRRQERPSTGAVSSLHIPADKAVPEPARLEHHLAYLPHCAATAGS